MDIWDNARRTIESKDKVVEGIYEEANRNLDSIKEEYEDIIKGFKNLNEGYEEEIQKFKDELKKRPEVMNVPPIKNLVGLEEKQMSDLKEKEQLIGILKDKFE